MYIVIRIPRLHDEVPKQEQLFHPTTAIYITTNSMSVILTLHTTKGTTVT